MTDEFLTNYLITERGWYKVGKNSAEPVFSAPYSGVEGYLAITCSMPYFDGENNFAGVIGLDYKIESLSNFVTDTTSIHTDINFMLDDEGEIIMSSQKMGTFAAGNDLSAVSVFMEKMVANESGGIETVTLKGKEYYLAFAPLKVSKWNFATLLEKEKVIAPAKEARANILAQVKNFKDAFGHLFLILFVSAAILIKSST